MKYSVMNAEFVKLLSLSEHTLREKAMEMLRETTDRGNGVTSSSAEQKRFMAQGNTMEGIRKESDLTELVATVIQNFRDLGLTDSAPDYWDGCRRCAVELGVPVGAAMRLAAVAYREGFSVANSGEDLWQTGSMAIQKNFPVVAAKAASVRRAVLRKRSPISRESMLQQLEVFQAARGQRLDR